MRRETKNDHFESKEHNWGLIGPGDWEKHSWKIQDDGWYEYKESYRSGTGDIEEILTVTEERVLSSSQLSQLKDLLEAEWKDEKTDACDGAAWGFKMYENGEIKKHRDLGYIYGIEPFESIVKLLTEE